MKISVNQIKQYTELNLTTDELVAKIKAQIGEIEHTTDLSTKYKGILIAEIVEKDNHPDAEKLGVYQVNIGTETIQVVAGDKELQVGDKVAYFTIGSKVPFNAYPDKFDGIIQKVKLRGVESNGMMGSARELDINSNHDQVLKLETDAPAGTPFAKAFDLDDTIIDIENKALSNRSDLFGHIGVAREVAGIQDIKFTSPEWYKSAEILRPKPLSNESLKISVTNNAASLCYRYMMVAIKNVNIKPSPMWLQLELVKAGVRPINNIVDITNYMMVVAGQPMHAFDYDKFVAKDVNSKGTAQLVIRQSKMGEKMMTLDGKVHEMDDSVVLICDSTNPVAIAGVMGGADTEIDDTTKNVLLEVATFDMYSIRRTSMKTGITSDAVTRFARGQDPNQCEPAMYKALEMIKELSGGELASNIIDNYPIRVQEWDVELSVKRLNMHLGLSLSKEQIVHILDNIELPTTRDKNDEDLLIVKVPTYRRDLRIREDVHEDIARQIGYSNVPVKVPNRTISPIKPSEIFEIRERIRQALKEIGANEILTYNFVNGLTQEKIGLDLKQMFRLKNALSPELEYMRALMTPSVSEKVTPNIRKGYDKIALFEINKTHNKIDVDGEKLPLEHNNVALVVAVDDKYEYENSHGAAYFTAKYYLISLMESLRLPNVEYVPLPRSDEGISQLPNWIKLTIPLYNSTRSAIVRLNGSTTPLGVVGEYTSQMKSALKLPKYSAGFEVNIDSFIKLITDRFSYLEPSKYPTVNFDITYICDSTVTASQLITAIKSQLQEGSNTRHTITVEDIYQKSGDSKRNITIGIKLQYTEKFLTTAEASKITKQISDKLAKELGVSVA